MMFVNFLLKTPDNMKSFSKWVDVRNHRIVKLDSMKKKQTLNN